MKIGLLVLEGLLLISRGRGSMNGLRLTLRLKVLMGAVEKNTWNIRVRWVCYGEIFGWALMWRRKGENEMLGA